MKQKLSSENIYFDNSIIGDVDVKVAMQICFRICDCEYEGKDGYMIKWLQYRVPTQVWKVLKRS